MTDTLHPRSLEELTSMVRATRRLVPVGAGTKPRLTAVTATHVSLLGLSGMIEYEPSEFTFTALAGTPVREITATLAARGQYLPFDPMLAAAGATLGGTVASGLNGPGRVRFGGVRDFILGVRFVDGDGQLLRLGGKVVKNAAGFDVPKLMVGSLGRLGVLAEITFKVFPRPAAARTLRISVPDAAAAIQTMLELGNSRFEPDGVDYSPAEKSVWLRLAGPDEGLEALANAVAVRWPGEWLADDAAARVWDDARELRWAFPEGVLFKVALAPRDVPVLIEKLGCDNDCIRVRISSGGNVAFVSASDEGAAAKLGPTLVELNATALTLRGSAPLFPVPRSRPAIEQAVKHALDPRGRFPGLEE